MSSNLTISYTSQTAAGSPAGAASADAPVADSPLGLFTALIDQLLAQVTTGAAKPENKDATDKTASVGEPERHDLPFGYSLPTAEAAAKPKTGAELLVDFTAQLETLQSQGSPATPEQLKQLDDTFAALAAALSLTSATPAATTPTDDKIAALVASLGNANAAAPSIAEAREKLLALSQSFAATAPALADKLEMLAGQIADLEASPDRLALFSGRPAGSDADTISDIIRVLLGAAGQDSIPAPDASGDELLQLLASLGLSTGTPASAASSGSEAVPAPLLRLSNQLSQLGTALAATAPELAQKLEAVATRLVSADADPKLLAQLSGAATDPDGAALDRLVQQLLDPKPAPVPLPATPRLAASADLAIPAPLASVPSKSAVAEVKAAQPQTTPVTADSATAADPRISATPVADHAPEPEHKPGPEAKTATIVAEAAKADPAAANNPANTPVTSQPLAAAASPRALPAAYQSVANPINMGQMAFEMVRQVHQGNSRFTLRLDPPELGRVDVKMHVDQQGAVTARLTVERAETLDLFQRDQRQLERALAQAGLDSARTTLEFSLRQNPNPGGEQRQQQQQNFGAPRFALGSDNDNAAMPAVTLYRGIASAGGVNIFA